MNEYTPTTSSIRGIYYREYYEYPKRNINVLDAEFDRWLAEVKAEAWDEGFNAGEGEAYEHEARLQWSMPHTCAKNPYREETE